MAKLATFIVAAVLGAALGVIGIIATVGAVSPSADHVADQVDQRPGRDGLRHPLIRSGRGAAGSGRNCPRPVRRRRRPTPAR